MVVRLGHPGLFHVLTGKLVKSERPRWLDENVAGNNQTPQHRTPNASAPFTRASWDQPNQLTCFLHVDSELEAEPGE